MTRLLLPIAIVAMMIGCAPTGGSADRAEPLRVAAASDLQAIMPTLLARFEAAKGVKVVATFGASGHLAQQIKQGAPFDVFLAANRKFVTDLADAKAIRPETVHDYAVGSLSLVVREDVPGTFSGLEDLKDPAIKKFAIANPGIAPYGAAAKQALEKAGLWDALEPKRVQAETVRQALQFVQTGNAEAGLVGTAIAKVKGLRAIPIDPKSHDPLRQALGVTAQSERPDDANAFVAFLLTGEGRAILKEAGFNVDVSESSPPSESPR